MIPNIMNSLEGVSSAFITFAQKEIIFSVVLFVIVLVLTTILKKRSPYLHYGLWALILLRLVLPTDLSLSFSARTLVNKAVVCESELLKKNSANSIQDEKMDLTTAPLQSEKKIDDTAGILSSVESSDTINSSIQKWPWKVVLFLLWLTGTIVFACVFLKRYFYYHSIVKHAKSVSDLTIEKPLELWRSRFQIRRNVKIVCSKDCLSPFTIGILQPVIYLPEVMINGTSTDSLESVIAHELAHIKHWDDLWIKIQNLIQLVYFYHPIVWLVNSQLNHVRERICDEQVLSHGTISPKAYGNSMLAVLKMNLFGVEGVEMLPSFGNHKKKFSARIRDITKISKVRKSNLWGTFLTLGFCAVFFLPMADSTSTFPSDNDNIQRIILRRQVRGQGNYDFHTFGAGSGFQKVKAFEQNEILCSIHLPAHLQNMEYAAVGIFDNDFKKYAVLKGENANGEIEFYFDSDGDNDINDEQPLKIKKKTSKYNYEGSAEWILTEYIKSQVYVDYKYKSSDKEFDGKFAVSFVYQPKNNSLEFGNYEFWLGEAEFDNVKYPIALCGGVQSDWYLRPTFDECPNAATKNEFRIDLNRNNIFEHMTVFDPVRNAVVQEKYYSNESFLVDGKYYKIESILTGYDQIIIMIAPKFAKEEVSEKASDL